MSAREPDPHDPDAHDPEPDTKVTDTASSTDAATTAPDPRTRNRKGGPLRVTLCPVNTAGVPWTPAEALRRRGVDARLVVFERHTLHPEADVSLDRSGGLAR